MSQSSVVTNCHREKLSSATPFLRGDKMSFTNIFVVINCRLRIFCRDKLSCWEIVAWQMVAWQNVAWQIVGESSGERHTPFRGLPLDGIDVCPAPLQTEDRSIVVSIATTSAFVGVICEVPRWCIARQLGWWWHCNWLTFNSVFDVIRASYHLLALAKSNGWLSRRSLGYFLWRYWIGE